MEHWADPIPVTPMLSFLSLNKIQYTSQQKTAPKLPLGKPIIQLWHLELVFSDLHQPAAISPIYITSLTITPLTVTFYVMLPFKAKPLKLLFIVTKYTKAPQSKDPRGCDMLEGFLSLQSAARPWRQQLHNNNSQLSSLHPVTSLWQYC